MNLRLPAVAIWIILLVVVTTWFVGFAAEREQLVAAGFVLPLFPILGMFWLRAGEERAGWTLFTVWLGSTYLSSGHAMEYAGFAVVVTCAVLGYLRWPWLFVVAWFGHIAWDFVPRELPALMADLPLACLIFDGFVGAYLALRVVTGRWSRPASGGSAPPADAATA